MDDFYLQAPKWVGLIEKFTSIFFPEASLGPSLKKISF